MFFLLTFKYDNFWNHSSPLALFNNCSAKFFWHIIEVMTALSGFCNRKQNQKNTDKSSSSSSCARIASGLNFGHSWPSARQTSVKRLFCVNVVWSLRWGEVRRSSMLQFYVILPTHCVALAGPLPVQRFPPACTRFFRCGCFSRFKAIRAGRRRPRHSGIFNTFLLFLLPLPAAGGADAAAGRGYFRRGYWFHGKEPSEAEEIRQVNFLKAEPCFSMFFFSSKPGLRRSVAFWCLFLICRIRLQVSEKSDFTNSTDLKIVAMSRIIFYAIHF